MPPRNSGDPAVREKNLKAAGKRKQKEITAAKKSHGSNSMMEMFIGKRAKTADDLAQSQAAPNNTRETEIEPDAPGPSTVGSGVYSPPGHHGHRD